MDEAEQRRLPKKRLLQSFHLEEAAERENYNSQGNALITSYFFNTYSFTSLKWHPYYINTIQMGFFTGDKMP